MGAHPDQGKDDKVFRGLGRVLIENCVARIVSSEIYFIKYRGDKGLCRFSPV